MKPSTAVIIFPHQLFRNPLRIEGTKTSYLVEDDLFFSQYAFHKQKLILHRSSMKYYQDYLIDQGVQVRYIEAHDPFSKLPALFQFLKQEGFEQVHTYHPNDYLLERRLDRASLKAGLELIFHPSPMFLNNQTGDLDLLGTKKTYFQTPFYIEQRKKRGILLDANNQALGGQWSFDTENRKRLPKGYTVPSHPAPAITGYAQEAVDYVETHFPGNLGISDPIKWSDLQSGYYPCTHQEAEVALNDFIKERLPDFGSYEDAMSTEHRFLFHSVLSPLLNIGLLEPRQLIDAALEAYYPGKAPLNSTEGFIRQVIGWREFVQLIYQKIGVEQRTRNFWGFTNPMPEALYRGDTGIIPVDHCIQTLKETGYNHHIERLMILGNFMLLCEIHPDAVYRWFMEHYIDAYDWVMVPNVYGMSQFADGGRMTTKPYVSGSNYIMKMSNYPKGDWQAIWDGLFWRFLDKHRKVFQRNPRWAMLIRSWDGMDAAKRAQHLENAEQFLARLLT